jgi:hypothetical protein
MPTPFRSFLGGFLALAATVLAVAAPSDAGLADAFHRPPDSAKPRVLWMWMGSNITAAGITRDLEALKDAGFSGATMFSLADTCTPWAGEIKGSPTPEVIAWTEPWWKLVRHAASEARRFGLDFGMHNCAGYTASAGPWVTPELSMQQLCWSSTTVTGDAANPITLPRPAIDPRAVMPFPIYNPTNGLLEKPELDARKNYYRDIAVLAVPAGDSVPREQIVDLTGKLGADGRLDWTPPPGQWTVYRFGHTTLGSLNQPAQWAATGLECDKMNPAAVTFHLEHALGEIRTHLGDLVGTGFTHVHFDSYEAGRPTWTPAMRAEFTARRGYDLVPNLVTFAGRTVGSAEDTKKFTADFDATIRDLYRDVYFATIARMTRAAGLDFMCEPYGGPWRQADVLPQVGRVMTEFWTNGGKFKPYELDATVAALRQYGRNQLEAEAFTGSPADSEWTETPAWLKPIGDAAFCAGINRLSLHRFVHQPWDDRFRPGQTMGQWGTHFDRTQTWWEPGKALVQYWQRCQAVLQWGKPGPTGNGFTVLSADPGLELRGTQRTADGTDAFFVANVARVAGSARLAFPVTGRQPELWDAVTGECRDLPEFSFEDGRTVVPLTLAETQSAFVVFRRPATPGKTSARNFSEKTPVLTLAGDWSVSFDPRWGGPAQPVSFAQLTDWTQHSEPAVRYYSGTATYRKTFALAEASDPQLTLALGTVHAIARVRLNGRDLGVVWCAPWEVRLPRGILRATDNQLEVEVTNVWANRLIGDEQQPPDLDWGVGHRGHGGPLKQYPEWLQTRAPRPSAGRYTFTTWNYFTATAKLAPSGLLGPVRLMRESTPSTSP